MPKAVENCKAELMKDPKFKPKNPKQSKEDAAWAVCQAAHQEKKMSEDGIVSADFIEGFFASQDNELSFISFGEGVIKPDITLHGDGTATVKKLAVFQLGEHRGFPYDQKWADEALDHFKQEKEEKRFRPPVFVSHEREGGKKPVRGLVEDLQQEGDILYADIERVPQDVLRDYPYRSVELRSDKQFLSGLALLGADEVPYFKFEPVVFSEQDESKTILTFKAKGGEDTMSTFEFAEKDKTFLQGIFEGFKADIKTLFSKKEDPPPDKKTFTEEQVKERENQVKLQTEKAQQVQFAEQEKKKDQTEMMKLLFADKDSKQGAFLAPRLKGKVEAVFAKLDNLEKVKFSETGADGKDAEKEGTVYGLLREVFSEIMTKPDALVVMGEKTRFSIAPAPAGSEPDAVKMEEAEKTAKNVVQKFGSKRKKEEKK